MLRVILPVLLVSCLAIAPARSDTPGLFDRMAGAWVGEGERVQTLSARHIRIEAIAISKIDGARLVSHNQITETPPQGPARSYVRDYWIQAAVGADGAYEFGSGAEVTSQGRYADGILEVEQDLGGSPAYVIRSRTRFGSQESTYEETVWHGEQPLARTTIHYRLRQP